MRTAKVKIILLTSKKLTDNTHPVVIRFYDGKRNYISLNYYCSINEWDKKRCRFKRNYDRYTEHNKILQKHEVQAQDIIDGFAKDRRELTLTMFKQLFLNESKTTTFMSYTKQRIESFKQQGRVGNAQIYTDTLNAVNNFRSNRSLKFVDIDYGFLKRMEEKLKAKGNSGNGISIYMRTIRAIFNSAIKEGYCKREIYPFKSLYNPIGYNIEELKEKTIPRCMTKNELHLFAKCTPTNKRQKFYKSLFMFSFYCRGMNFSDLANLQWKQIEDDRLYYHRKKTGQQISIKITPEIREIIKNHGTMNTKYVFPILNDTHKTPRQQFNRVRRCLKKFNAGISAIAESLGIEKELTSYVARHTWATSMKRLGVSTAIISEGMAHSTEKTTQIYLAKFENEIIDEANQLLINSITDL